jgi:hypothetical protein
MRFTKKNVDELTKVFLEKGPRQGDNIVSTTIERGKTS